MAEAHSVPAINNDHNEVTKSVKNL